MSDFWVRKMKTYFQRFDFDKDGLITHDDFVVLTHGFVKFGKLDEDRGKIFENYLSKIFSIFTEGNTEKGLDEDTLIASATKKLSDPTYHQSLVNPLALSFNALDANANGSIQMGELMLFFEMLGLDKNMAPATFEAIDTDKDGAITRDEFIAAGVEFFTGEDENSPTKLFWGPLI